MRVPVWVKEDTRVRGTEIDPQPASSSRQQEDENVPSAVKLLNVLLPIVDLSTTVNAVEQPTPARRTIPPEKITGKYKLSVTKFLDLVSKATPSFDNVYLHIQAEENSRNFSSSVSKITLTFPIYLRVVSWRNFSEFFVVGFQDNTHFSHLLACWRKFTGFFSHRWRR